MLKRMMIGISAVVLGLAAANSAKAECDGIYLAVRGGGSRPTIDDKDKGSNRFDFDGTDLMLSGALGYRYEYFRAEVEYIWRDTNESDYFYSEPMEGRDPIKGGDHDELKYKSYMFNVYWDLSPYTWFTPYLNAGIGWTDMEATWYYPYNSDAVKEDRKSGNNFTWSVGGGLSAKMTNRLNLDIGYRYFDFGKLGDGQIHNHEFYGGLRYVF